MALQRWLLGAAFAAGLSCVVRAEEEVKATPVESAVSVMLLGSIGFQMLLFYLVNWDDADIRRYAWRVISSTISIFCAVLIFQGFNGIVETYISSMGGEMWEVFVDMLQLVFWLSGMQVALAICSGAINEMWGGTQPNEELVKLNMNTWAVLFSHVAGFSAINAWGAVQQKLLCSSASFALLVVPIGYCGLYAMIQAYNVIRNKVALGDDGEVDEYEERWDETTAECESDVAALSLSFLTVQSIRFWISGVLPNQEGIEKPTTAYTHGGHQWHALLGCGFLFLLSFIVVALLHKRLFGEEPSKRVERLLDILNNYLIFGTSWCFFYAVKWGLSSTRFTEEPALLNVVIAIVLSFTAFLCIFALDKALDYQLLGQDTELVDEATEKIILSFSILVGFSWEQSFDVAVGVIAVSVERRCPQVVAKLLMSIFLVIIVLPAWRKYILPKEQELNEEADATEEGAHKAVLKEAAGQHYQLLLDHEADDAKLDRAHLKMIEHRRRASGKELTLPEGLKHYRVTAKGIEEVEKGAGQNQRKKATHQAHAEVVNWLE